MKQVLILITLMTFSVAANAQRVELTATQRGNFILGTRLGFSAAKSSVEVNSSVGSIKGNGGSSYQLNLSPGLGYFFARNFAIGIAMDWLKTHSSTGIDVSGGTEPVKKTDNDIVLFGPFARVFLPVSDDHAFFIGSSLGFGNSKNEFVSNNESQRINNRLLNIGVGPGFTIFSKNGLALEALVKYNFSQSKSDIDVSGVKRTSETWTNAVDFSVGVQYYFGGFRAANQ